MASPLMPVMLLACCRLGKQPNAPLEPREQEVVLALGAQPFELQKLGDLLERTLMPLSPGERVPCDWYLPALPLLLKTLGASPTEVKRLGQLPCLPDQRGLLRRPGQLLRANKELRRLYGDLRPFVSLDLEEALGRNPGQDPFDVGDLEESSKRTGPGPFDVGDLEEFSKRHTGQDGAGLVLGESPEGLEESSPRHTEPEPSEDRSLPVGASLDEESRRDLLGVLDRLGVQRWGARELIGDLADPFWARELTREGGEALFSYLQEQPSRLTRDLGRLSLFHDEEGTLWPLVEEEDALRVWLSPEGELGRWLRSLPRPGRVLIHPLLQERFFSFLRYLGGRVLDLPSILEALEQGALKPGAEDLTVWHRLVEERRDELTPRLCRLLARLPLFPDDEGRLRPLLGEERAWIAGDEEIRKLVPGVPWLAHEVASLSYVRHLGVSPVGAFAVAGLCFSKEISPLRFLQHLRRSFSPDEDPQDDETAR